MTTISTPIRAKDNIEAQYIVKVREAHGISLSNLRVRDCYIGEIVRIDTGAVAYSTKYYHELRTARLQAARYLKRYEHHLAKHGIGFEEQEAARKAAERAERDAKREADRRVRDEAPAMLEALRDALSASDANCGDSLMNAIAALRPILARIDGEA